MTQRRFSVDERRARLARRHHLLPSAPAADVTSAAAHMVGLHATDPATVYLSALARVPDLMVAEVERALYDELTLVRHLCMRRTLFVLPRDLVTITQAAATDVVAARMRTRLAKELVAEGVTDSGERWLTEVADEIFAAVERLGPATGAQLAKAVPRLQTKLAGAGPVAARWRPRSPRVSSRWSPPKDGSSAACRREPGPAARTAGDSPPIDRPPPAGQRRSSSWFGAG